MYATDFRTKRRFSSKRHQQWKREAALALALQEIQTFTGKVRFTLSLRRPDKRRRDCFNYVKAVSDLLIGPVLDDDSQIEDGRVYWTTDVENGCRVEVEAL